MGNPVFEAMVRSTLLPMMTKMPTEDLLEIRETLVGALDAELAKREASVPGTTDVK